VGLKHDSARWGPIATRVAESIRAAEYVDKVIKGEPPSTMPMEQPREFDRAVNLTVAKQLGIKVPQSVLLRATKIIE
jgi:putative tryptophan/tyrosine transport system substrate-binding protein